MKKDHELIHHQISAGADPTATVQKAIIYHLLRNPSVLDKLRVELDAANLSFPASYEEAHNSSKLPYLEAVIKEGLRIHPTVGLCLERVGTQLSQFFYPLLVLSQEPEKLHFTKEGKEEHSSS